MAVTLGPLQDGSRVVIIGGGPGGAASALALKRTAAGLSRHIEVTILEGKEFVGERHYNQCVGVISPPLPTILDEQLDVPFPHHLDRGIIQGYILHTAKEQIVLEGDNPHSISLRRVHFDAYMLDVARKAGIRFLPARAIDLEFHDECVVVYSENMPVEADVVIGAFGLDEGSAALFSRMTDYHPPKALSSVVTKYHPGLAGMQKYGNYIHAFLPVNPRIEFGAITPKGNHLTINIAGRTVDVNLMRFFLALPGVQASLPNIQLAGEYDPQDLRFFKGRFPYSLARGYYGNRYVTVGDAAGLVRAFKGKGVNSAILSGIRAAHTILHHGISEYAFHKYYRFANRDITQDFPYGRTMRVLTILLSRYRLLDYVIRAAKRDAYLRSALLDAVSAQAPYREVIANTTRPGAILSFLKTLARVPHKEQPAR